MVAIFFVMTILVLVSVDAAVVWMRRRRLAQTGTPVTVSGPGRIHGVAERLSLPGGLFLHRGHTWAEIQASGSVRVGMDDFLSQTLGRLDRVTMRRPGERIAQGEAMLTAEQSGRRMALPAPVSGMIESVNEGLMADPHPLTEDAYRAGWTYVVVPTRLGREIQGLRVAETARAWLEEEVRRFTAWITGLGTVSLATLPDGGMPVVGALAQLNQAAWEEFEVAFLGSREVETTGKVLGS